MTSVREIYELQELDWEIDRCRADLASVEERLQDDSALVQAKRVHERRDANIAQLKKEHGTRDLGHQELEQRVKDLEGKLYGGEVKKAKGVESMEHELQYARQQAQEAEDALLSLMIGLDEQERLAAESGSQLCRMKRERKQVVASLSKEKMALAEQMATLDVKRDGMISRTDSQHLARYERLRQTRQGYAVAKVERGMCQGCRLTLPTHELQKARMAEEPVLCSSCGRILYLS